MIKHFEFKVKGLNICVTQMTDNVKEYFKDFIEESKNSFTVPPCLDNYDGTNTLITLSVPDYYYTDSLMLGYALLSPCSKSCWIDYLYIKEEYSSKVYGKILLDFIKEHYSNLKIYCDERDERALKFYKNSGFKFAQDVLEEV